MANIVAEHCRFYSLPRASAFATVFWVFAREMIGICARVASTLLLRQVPCRGTDLRA